MAIACNLIRLQAILNTAWRLLQSLRSTINTSIGHSAGVSVAGRPPERGETLNPSPPPSPPSFLFIIGGVQVPRESSGASGGEQDHDEQAVAKNGDDE